MRERWELAFGRIQEIETAYQSQSEQEIMEPFATFFGQMASFVVKVLTDCKDIASKSRPELERLNEEIYRDVLAKNYGESYANPKTAQERLGEEYAASLSFFYTQLRGLIPLAFEFDAGDARREEEIVILMELFLELYSAFVVSAQDSIAPDPKEIRDILYWYVSDYADVLLMNRIQDQLDPDMDFATRIIMESDLTDLTYLYRFGEYITPNELGTAAHLNELSEEAIQSMADTYTEGYRIGFVNTGKDLSIKSTVNIRYSLGFERVVKAAIFNFEKMGLRPVIYRSAYHAATGSIGSRIGYYGAVPNRQYEYDHREDSALYMDKAYRDRKLDLLKLAYEEYKALANGHAGPAVMEVFGEKPFIPAECTQALRLNEKQQKLSVEYSLAAGRLVNEYIKGEERSFTIIAYPVPEIDEVYPAVGEFYKAIFDETVKLNTLDYITYRDMQQILIDTMDTAVEAHIEGCNGNSTNLTVALRKLENPEKESQFENCVADVNIPVGEVFTSPVLKGTNGTLFVSEVFLNDLRFENLEVIFEDGFIKDYNCSNFDSEKECRKYIEENVLFHRKTLPMGEFAIGTNTTAYAMAKKYHIFDRLPILIAEKTGPHFAVGDTCYSHAEDIAVYNPDGKEIIARDNEYTIRRKDGEKDIYFSCHTDITIPYDELGKIWIRRADGTSVTIIENGRFVLPGLEKLNEPL